MRFFEPVIDTMESRFYEPPRKTKIGSKNRRGRARWGKITVFDWGGETTFRSSCREVRKTEGSRNRNSTVNPNVKPKHKHAITYVDITRAKIAIKQLPREIGEVIWLREWVLCKAKAFCKLCTQAKKKQASVLWLKIVWLILTWLCLNARKLAAT